MLNVSAYFIGALALLGWSFIPFLLLFFIITAFVGLSALSEVISMIWFLDYLTALDGCFLVILMIYDGNRGGI